ncbi:hypothetical protein BC831DRAFT_455780 [Entophlyctis helioformis]|nr:hypothetical protein BC831DRAFT_455780 [Entophlyctis helioformis]
MLNKCCPSVADHLVDEAKRVPQCDGASTNPDLSDNTNTRSSSAQSPATTFQTVAIRDFVLSMGWRRVAIISQTDAYGTGILKAFQDAVAGSPLKIISLASSQTDRTMRPAGKPTWTTSVTPTCLLFSCLPLRSKSRVFSKPPRSVA